MTDEQRDLFRRYRPTAMAVAWRLSQGRRRHYDDLRAAALVGLWRAVTSYDAARGTSIRTHVVRVCRWECGDWLRGTAGTRRRSPCYHPGALDRDVADAPAGPRLHDAAEYLDLVLDGLGSRARLVAELLRQGLQQQEVARRLGVCSPRVSQIVRQIAAHARQRRDTLTRQGA